ncbi:MAG: sensor histidine kinase [Thermomicrobiales bacterium]
MIARAGRRTRVAERITYALLAVIGAIAAAMTIALTALDLPRAEVPLMLRLLVGSAVVSLVAGGLFIVLSSGRRWNRLSARLAAAHLVGAVVVLVNIAYTAYEMFFSSHDLWLLTLLLGYSLAIAMIYSTLVSASLSDAIGRLSDAAVKMAGGDLSTRVPIAGERELADLGHSFNQMATRLETAFARQHELEEARQGLIAAVSHDLRTPLASLRVMVEAINDGVADDPATIRRYVSAMERETISLGKLIDDLFEMARLDAGQVTLRLQASPISSLVLETIEAMNAQAVRQGVLLQAHCPPYLEPVMIDADRIQRVLYNLVQNAIRHTPADGSVVVEVLDRGADIHVSVRDTGEGIPESDLPHVFDRFYRGDKARTRDGAHGGAGLGLSIARRLVETHGGRIWVAQPTDGGSVFTFTLPKSPVVSSQ